MFLKNNLSSKNIWSNYTKSNEENFNDWHIFSAHEKPEKVYQKSSQTIVPINDEETHLSTDSVARLGQWLSSLPDDFEIKRSQSTVKIRSLSDPVWKILSDDELSAHGDGWNADFSLLKNMYENILETTDEDELQLKSSKNLGEMKFCKLENQKEMGTLNFIREIIGDNLLPKSASANTIPCSKMQNDCSFNRKYSASFVSSSPVNDTVCENFHTKSDDTFYTANSCSLLTKKESITKFNDPFYNCLDSSKFMKVDVKKTDESIPENDFEHISDVFLDISSDSTLQPQTSFVASNSVVIAEIPQTTDCGKPYIGRTRKFKPRNAATFHRNTGFPAQSFVPAQPLVQWSSLPLATVDLGHMALNNAAYNNFMIWQWPIAQKPNPIHDQSIWPQITQIIPPVQYLSATYPFFTNPNLLATTTTPFYNNIILFRMLQQQILMQRQQQFTAFGLFMQQQQCQHPTNQMWQQNLRNFRYKRSPRCYHHKYNNLNQKKNQSNNFK